MTTYGPWIQDPDYTQTSQVTDSTRLSVLAAKGIDAFPRLWGTASFTSVLAPAFVEDIWFIGLEPELEDNVMGDGAGDGERANWLQRAGGYSGSEDVYINTAHFVKGHAPFPVAWYPVPYAPATPDGAVGIEWQSTSLSERLGVALLPETVMRNSGVFAEPGVGYIMNLGYADWGRALAETYRGPDPDPAHGVSTVLHSQAMSVVEDTTVDFQLGARIDLTDHMSDLAAGGVLYTLNDGFVPHVTPDTGFDESWSYGTTILRAMVEETLRPPVYRWIYDTVPVAYRRIYPRDDGLAGGARRNWPPSKGVQTSNRTSGYL